MKLLFDHNQSPRLVKRLADLHPDSSASYWGWIRRRTLCCGNQPGQDGYTIVTKDSDFSDMSVLGGFPPKVIWIRLGNCTTQQIEDLLRKHHEAVVAFESNPMFVGLLSLF